MSRDGVKYPIRSDKNYDTINTLLSSGNHSGPSNTRIGISYRALGMAMYLPFYVSSLSKPRGGTQNMFKEP
jgi:hypothetical protein